MAAQTYRQWLQDLSGVGTGLPSQETSALLQVVGDDGIVNHNFEADPYGYTKNDRGQVFSTTGGSGNNVGYGPQGINSLNDIYYQKYLQNTSPNNNAGGGSAGTAQDQADEQAYWQDQAGLADQQLARIPQQTQVGDQNIDSSYQSAYDRLVGDKNVTQRDYTTKKDQTNEDNITAKNSIDTSVRNRNTGLQRLLGAKGAGNSSAATILAPYAAAKEGAAQRGQVQTAYGRNVQGLDTAWGDYQNDWDTSAGDLATQRDTQKNTLHSGLATTEAQLQQQKADALVQKAQAGGASYTAARAQRAPYTARINQLISQIDSLGAQPQFTPKTAAYKAPDLASYTYDKYAAPTANSGVDPNLAQGAGAYWTLLSPDKKKEQSVV